MIKPFAVFTLSAFALACTSALAATGTYQGKALGHNAEVEVAVTLDNDKITNVQSHICSRCYRYLPGKGAGAQC